MRAQEVEGFEGVGGGMAGSSRLWKSVKRGEALDLREWRSVARVSA